MFKSKFRLRLTVDYIILRSSWGLTPPYRGDHAFGSITVPNRYPMSNLTRRQAMTTLYSRLALVEYFGVISF
jgi:hypothetical protein